MKKIHCKILAFALIVITQIQANDSVGSVVGDVSHESAKLWVYAEEDEKISVELHPEVDVKPKIVRSEFSSTSYFVELGGLSADTRYKYEVSINGEVSSLSSGRFRTCPLPGEASKFSVAVISCLKNPDRDWQILKDENPNYVFLIGDNIYIDGKEVHSFDTMRGLYLDFRKNKDFASLLRKRSALAVWDDHDMGPNNSDGTLEGKEESLKAFMDVWPNPSYGTAETPGVFFTKQHGDMDFFMLDVRYHRDKNGKEKGRILGDEQFEWLIEELKKSKSPFKIICGGSPINHSKPKDGWESWPWARARLYQAIADHKITGVMFVGGDLHFADVEKIPSADTGISYPIYNIVSSGFAAKSRKGWNYPRQQNPYVILNIDTTVDDPTLEIQIKDKDRTYNEIILKASKLR